MNSLRIIGRHARQTHWATKQLQQHRSWFATPTSRAQPAKSQALDELDELGQAKATPMTARGCSDTGMSGDFVFVALWIIVLVNMNQPDAPRPS